MEELRLKVGTGEVSVRGDRLVIGSGEILLSEIVGVVSVTGHTFALLLSSGGRVLVEAESQREPHLAGQYINTIRKAIGGPTADAFPCGDDGQVLRYSHHLLSIGWLTIHHDHVAGLRVDDSESGVVHMLLKDGRSIRLTSIGEVEHEALYRWFTRGVLEDGKDGVHVVHGVVFTRPDAPVMS